MNYKFEVGDNVQAFINNAVWKPYIVTDVVTGVQSPSYLLTDQDGNVILKYEGLMRKEPIKV